VPKKLKGKEKCYNINLIYDSNCVLCKTENEAEPRAFVLHRASGFQIPVADFFSDVRLSTFSLPLKFRWNHSNIDDVQRL
jgi:hypothetical protein